MARFRVDSKCANMDTNGRPVGWMKEGGGEEGERERERAVKVQLCYSLG